MKTESKTATRRAELVKYWAGLTAEQRADLIARVGSVPTCEGHPLSTYNSILLLYQCPGATMVGGFRQWLKAGRCVMKGESGSMILFPRKGKEDPNRKPGELSSKDDKVRFGSAWVFDVSQTRELEPGEKAGASEAPEADAEEQAEDMAPAEPKSKWSISFGAAKVATVEL